jgi:hypothetical protein
MDAGLRIVHTFARFMPTRRHFVQSSIAALMLKMDA